MKEDESKNEAKSSPGEDQDGLTDLETLYTDTNNNFNETSNNNDLLQQD